MEETHTETRTSPIKAAASADSPAPVLTSEAAPSMVPNHKEELARWKVWRVAFVVFVRRRLLSRATDITGMVIAVVLLLGCLVVWLCPPLLPSVTASASFRLKDGAPIEAEVFSAVAVPGRFYVCLPTPVLDRYQWFMADFRTETASWLAESPVNNTAGFKWVNRAGNPGLDLEFRKIEDLEWKVSFSEAGASFSNGVLAVELKL